MLTNQGQRWAAIVGIVLASLSLAFLLLQLAGLVFETAQGRGSIVSLAIGLVFVAAFAQLVVHLSKALKWINQAESGTRGFEVIMPGQQPPPLPKQ
jgi:hypothetical protein